MAPWYSGTTVSWFGCGAAVRGGGVRSPGRCNKSRSCLNIEIEAAPQCYEDARSTGDAAEARGGEKPSDSGA